MSIDIIGWITGWHLERFVNKIFKGSKTLWEKLSPEVQEALIKSSSVVAVINSIIDQTPSFILDVILNKVGISKEKLHEILVQVANVLNIAKDENDSDIVVLLGNVKDKLASLDGGDWEGYSETLANFIALYNTPQETTFSVIASVMKFVYESFVRGKF